MTSKQIKHLFIRDCYDGRPGVYRQARRRDYLKVQQEWSFYIDSLCRDGIITQAEYDRAVF